MGARSTGKAGATEATSRRPHIESQKPHTYRIILNIYKLKEALSILLNLIKMKIYL